MSRSLTLAIVVLTLVSCGENKATVDCRNSGGIGYNCVVTHTEGEKPLNVCWVLAVECVNGTVTTSTGCQHVDPGSHSTYFIPLTDIAHAEKCDKVRSVRIKNLTTIVE
jgi:hypothetical protein